MTKRGVRKQVERYNASTRAIAYDDARRLALDIVSDQAVGVTAYQLGVVLAEGEIIWRENVPADWIVRETLTWPNGQTSRQWQHQGVRPWLVTNRRLVSRQPDGTLAQVPWEVVVGCRADLTGESVIFDAADGWQGGVGGPAVAVIAVAAIASVYGPQALVDHPAIAPLRSTPWAHAPRAGGTSDSRPAIAERPVSL